MSTFSETYTTAYHVFPLHAAKTVWASGALLSKQQLWATGSRLRRRTTADVDEALGFRDYVHFYLPRGKVSFADLPILQTQLKEAVVPPFPHVVLALPTSVLDDGACTLCNWNIAVGRPKAPELGSKPGNWARGTAAAQIAAFWERFRQCNPSLERRRGHWHPGIGVPVLVGDEIAAYHRFVRETPGLRPTAWPELLLRTRYALASPAKLYALSSFDEKSLQLLGPPPGGIPLLREEFEGYSHATDDRVAPAVRSAIDDYFRTDGAPLPTLDYDARR